MVTHRASMDALSMRTSLAHRTDKDLQHDVVTCLVAFITSMNDSSVPLRDTVRHDTTYRVEGMRLLTVRRTTPELLLAHPSNCWDMMLP